MQPRAKKTAKDRFQDAFDRLKANTPKILPRGTPVTQNNVAREAGTDPTALRKTRFPTLVREIQAWRDIHESKDQLKKERSQRQREAHRDLKEQIDDLTKQRDDAQSQRLSAHRTIVQLMEENRMLKARLDELEPAPTPLRRRKGE